MAIATATDGLLFADTQTQRTSSEGVRTTSDGSVRVLAPAGKAEAKGVYIGSLTDGVVFSESITTLGGFFERVVEAVTFSDSPSVIGSFSVTASDGAEFSENVAGTVRTAGLPNGEVVVTFTSAKATISFTVKKPTITF